VLGVSPDSVESHRKFKAKYEIPFPLLVDEAHRVAKSYGVWVKKRMAGNTYFGIRRSTFLIGPQGLLLRAFEDVKPAGHSHEVLEALQAD
jgi:peroxiredoxin Q/BCP